MASKSGISSPRSEGAPPRRGKPRRTLSTTSARSDTSARLTSIVEHCINDDKFKLSPLKRKSVLPDDTDIEAPRRASWWKRLEGSSRDVLEALDTNRMPGELLLEDYEFEVQKDKQNQSVPESSDNESVASIIVPQRRLFIQKKQPQGRFGDIMATRKSLGKSHLEDQDKTIHSVPKNLFKQGQPRNRPVFPAALLNSTNKTINKTVEPEPEYNKQGRNLFGQGGTKRKKNMFTDFVLSESEDDSEIQHKVFGFKKNDKRMSLATRNKRMPSLTPSVTTDIDIDDWNLLPSSTMIGNGSMAMEVSSITPDKDIELAQDDNQDVTLTGANQSLEMELNKQNTSKNLKKESLRQSTLSKTRKQSIVNDKSTDKEYETKNEDQVEDDDKDVTLTDNEPGTLISDNPKRQTLNCTSLSKSRKLSDEYNTLTGANQSLELELNKQNTSKNLKKESLRQSTLSKTRKQSIVNDKSTDKEYETKNEDQVEDDDKDVSLTDNEPGTLISDNPKRQTLNRTSLSKSKKLSDEYNKKLSKEIILESNVPEDTHGDNQDVNEQTTSKSSVEDQMAESHEESLKNKSEEAEQSIDQRSEISAKDSSKEDPNEDMEEMVWNDDEEHENNTAQEENDQKDDEDVEIDQDEDEDMENDEEQNEDVESDLDVEDEIDDQEVSDQVIPTKDISNKSQKIVETSVEEEQMEQENEAVDRTPNVQNRIKDSTEVKSPESVLKNISSMSFKPIGRSTSFRRTRSPTENIISRPTLIPIQESIIGSEGSRNSSTEGSGWDSHRVTRKTLRQTFGRDFTPRKSLRALVMENSAKRQTDMSKNTSKINKTRNKTLLEDTGKNAPKANETTNKTVLEDIRDRRVSNRNLSNDQLPTTKSPDPGVSAHHVSDPNISKPKVSYHKSVHEMTQTSPEVTNQEESGQTIDDSGPGISIHASYGHGMSGETSNDDDGRSSVKMHQRTSEQRKSVKKSSIRLEADDDVHEALDYDPSLHEESTHEESNKNISECENKDRQAQEVSGTEAQNDSDHEQEKEDSELEESIHDIETEKSDKEEDARESEPEVEIEESEHDESQKVSEPESEHEDSEEDRESEQEQEQSQQEIEPESEQEEEQSQQEIEPESEQEEEQSQQEIEPESDQEQEQSQQEIEPESDQEQEQSQQEIEPESDQEQEQSQQEIEPESEAEEHEDSQQEIAVSDQEQSQESDNDISQNSDQESDREIDPDNEQDNHVISDNDHVDADEAERQQNSKRYTERVVFDNEMSDQEIGYDHSERVSRQITDTEISEQVSDVEMEDQCISKVSDQDNHGVSVGTKKSLLLMQMQKIAQENMELRQKIREKVEDSLKRKRDCNPLQSPMQPNIFSSIRRKNKPEPKKPKIKPRQTTSFTIGTLPKEFLDDLKYKPPKRFQPANAPWITKRLYKFLESKLEPKYDYRARVRAEELVQSIYGFTQVTRRRPAAPAQAVDELKREMARLHVVTTHFDFYEFFHEFMPREIRIKVNPDIVNKIPMPRNGIFADILQLRPVDG